MHHRSRTPKLLGAAVAVVLGLGVGVPPAFAGPPAPGELTPEADPVPRLVAGTDTAAPRLVTGVDEPAPGADDTEAARAHLAAHRDRYQVDPAELVATGVEHSWDGRRTVRFEQRHGGLPVLGATYLVHLAGEGDTRRVESVGGKYFTGLAAPAAQNLSEEVLRGLALASVEDGPARTGVTAEDGGLVVLPGGAGRPARHFTVRGTDPTVWEGTAREVYLDATTGAVALARTVHAPGGPGSSAAAPAPAPAAGLEPAVGTVPDVHGNPVKVNIARLPDGTYQLIDLTRPSPLTVYDAGGRDEYRLPNRLPGDLRPVSSPTPDFPASLATTGAAEAQRNAAAVYDFFHDRLGRNGIDGAGGPIDAVVNVTSQGKGLTNAYWGKERMTYGSGNDKYYPFAVALDVAGHEMTHGVVEKTAGLVSRDQPDALNEALADYFGNAVEATALGIPMTDPRAALLGESLCRTGTQEACAERRLDTGRTTVNDYVGFPVGFTADASHDNSAIMSGALWDIRRTLDPLLADRLVYRALAEYLTPLDTFVDARDAVLAAGRSLGLTRAQLRTVATAFDAHGIKEGWERRIGIDSRTLVRSLTDGGQGRPDVAKGRWVLTNGEAGVITGTVGSSAEPVRLSPVGDKRSNFGPATDGTVAAWISQGAAVSGPPDMSVLVRPLDGGDTHSVYSGGGRLVQGVRVAGGNVAFDALDYGTGRYLPWLSVNGAPAAPIPLPDGHHGSGVSLHGDLLAWTEHWQDGGRTVYAPTVYSVSAGKVVAQYVAGGPGATGTEAGRALLTANRLLWLETPLDGSRGTSIRSGALDGSGATDLLTGSTTEPRRIDELTASEQAVTFAYAFTWPKGRHVVNSDLPKLWQLPIGGGTPQRFSCNRGGQYLPVADHGTRVLWADATPGRTDLVVREHAAGTC
ncbi:M4 family metallopeptidase [Kitasatospora sp. NPDC001159]